MCGDSCSHYQVSIFGLLLRRLLKAYATILRFLHMSTVSIEDISVDQFRHFLASDSEIDIELCQASSQLGLATLCEQFETPLIQNLSLETFIPVCTYASLNHRHQVLQGCYIWLKRYISILCFIL